MWRMHYSMSIDSLSNTSFQPCEKQDRAMIEAWTHKHLLLQHMCHTRHTRMTIRPPLHTATVKQARTHVVATWGTLNTECVTRQLTFTSSYFFYQKAWKTKSIILPTECRGELQLKICISPTILLCFPATSCCVNSAEWILFTTLSWRPGKPLKIRSSRYIRRWTRRNAESTNCFHCVRCFACSFA